MAITMARMPTNGNASPVIQTGFGRLGQSNGVFAALRRSGPPGLSPAKGRIVRDNYRTQQQGPCQRHAGGLPSDDRHRCIVAGIAINQSRSVGVHRLTPDQSVHSANPCRTDKYDAKFGCETSQNSRCFDGVQESGMPGTNGKPRNQNGQDKQCGRRWLGVPR